jgi:MYXO-CTERM domain-containing protein
MAPGRAAAQKDWLSCQTDLVDMNCFSLSTVPSPDCTAVAGTWDGKSPLIIKASCTPCSGGGSDIKCTPEEKVVSGANLYVATTVYEKVPGTFAKIGTCDFGVSKWQFNGSLASGEYFVIAKVSGFDDMCLFQFAVSGGIPPTGDGGTVTPKYDLGGPVPKNEAGLPIVDTLVPTGDGAAGTGPGDDEGCGCRMSAEPSLDLLLVLLLAPLAWIRRRQ